MPIPKNETERKALETTLFETQKGICFICRKPIDLDVHRVHIDHIIPLNVNGVDEVLNYALTHEKCNESKQDSNLRVAQTIQRFYDIRETAMQENRGANLADILREFGGGKHSIQFAVDNGKIRYSLPEISSEIMQLPLYTDKLSGFRYFFTELPIAYLHHDDKINPRSIGTSVSKLIKEFQAERPQLHPSLGWIIFNSGEPSIVKIFDGQHKAAAQILLNVKNLPVRIFVNPDDERLLETNMKAGTSLRQVAFDKSVQHRMGSRLWEDKILLYKKQHHLEEDDWNFSEVDLVRFFKGQKRDIKGYIAADVRDWVARHSDNELRNYIGTGGRQAKLPLSYSTVDKTFHAFFINGEPLETSIASDDGSDPRTLEKNQILELMNIFAREILIRKFDTGIGVYHLENKVQHGDPIPLDHLRAYRMCREEVLQAWLKLVRRLIIHSFTALGEGFDEKKPFQTQFPQPLRENLRKAIVGLGKLSMWQNLKISPHFGGKQSYEFWDHVFRTGETPLKAKILPKGVNILDIIKGEQ